jgi:hypothetical protein
MRGVLLVLVACALSVSTHARETQMEQNNSATACARPREAFDVGLVLRNSTLYEQVYVWMHEKDVQNWNYSRAVRHNGSTEIECATVTYDTFIDSPTFFAQFLRNFHMALHFPINVRKEVCVDGGAVEETATVSVPLIHELSLSSRYEVQAETVRSSLDAQYSVPWYINFLIYDIEQHLHGSFKLKLDSFAQSLCAPRGEQQWALLRAPEKQYALHGFRREAPRPLHAAASPLRRVARPRV